MSVFNAFVAYKFIKILSQPWKETDAYKLGIIDDKGKILKKKKKLTTSAENKAYTIFHRLIWNLKKVLQKLPMMKGRIGTMAAALWFLKEHVSDRGTLIEDTFVEYLQEQGYDIDSMLVNERFSNRKTIIERGLYAFEGKKIFIEENIKPFDEILGIPLFKINFLGEERVVAKEELEEITMAVGDGGNLAGLDGKPPVSKKNQKVHRRKAVGVTGGVKESLEPKQTVHPTFAGTRIFKVKSEEYCKCMQGRRKHERWNRKLNMDEFSNTEIRKYAHRNPGKSVIVQDENTGEMSYLMRHFRDRLKTP